MTETKKPYDDRVTETVRILRNIVGLGIPLHSPEVQELKQRFDAYIKDGVCWTGTVSFLQYGRMADVNLPRGADKYVEVNLRKARASKLG